MRTSTLGLGRPTQDGPVLSRRWGGPKVEQWSPGGSLLIGWGIALALALALILVHFSALAALVIALLPPAVWLMSRSHGGLVLGLVLILVVPYWQTFGSAQLTTLRLASVAAALTLIVSHRIRLHRIDLALVVLVAITVAGWLLQYHQPHAGRVLSIEMTPIGFYLGARAVPMRWIQPVLRAALYAGAVGALTVIYEYVRGHAVFIDPTRYVWNATNQYIFRPGGIYGSPPGASTVLTFVIVFGLACFALTRGRTRVISAACISICAVALVLTFTRAGMIATAVGALLFLWLIRSPLLRPLRVAWAIVAMAALLFVVVPTLQQSTTFREGVLRGGTLATRETYWSIALPVVTANQHNLFFGVGTGALETPFISGDAPVPAYIAVAPDLTNNSLHSQYITVLVEQGLLGLVVLVAFLAVCIFPLVRTARMTRQPVPAALAASLLALAAIFSVDTALLHGPSFAMFMTAAGLSANLASQVSHRVLLGTDAAHNDFGSDPHVV